MPRGIDSSNDPRRRPKVVDLNHYRQTGEVKDVNEINVQERSDNISSGNQRTNHPTNKSRPVEIYDYVEEEKKISEQDNRFSEDTDPTPYKGIPRPQTAKEYSEERDFIDRNPANKTPLEKMWDNTLGKIIDKDTDDE